MVSCRFRPPNVEASQLEQITLNAGFNLLQTTATLQDQLQWKHPGPVEVSKNRGTPVHRPFYTWNTGIFQKKQHFGDPPLMEIASWIYGKKWKNSDQRIGRKWVESLRSWYGAFHSRDTPIAGWFIMDNPSKMNDERGDPYFRKPPYDILLWMRYILINFCKIVWSCLILNVIQTFWGK